MQNVVFFFFVCLYVFFLLTQKKQQKKKKTAFIFSQIFVENVCRCHIDEAEVLESRSNNITNRYCSVWWLSRKLTLQFILFVCPFILTEYYLHPLTKRINTTDTSERQSTDKNTHTLISLNLQIAIFRIYAKLQKSNKSDKLFSLVIY